MTVSPAAKEGKKLVVIGSSFIGTEIAITTLKRKLESIDIVEKGNTPFEHVLGKEVGGAIQKVESLVRFMDIRSFCAAPRIPRGEVPYG